MFRGVVYAKPPPPEGRRRIEDGVQNQASASQPEKFWMYPLLGGYKISNLSHQFVVHTLLWRQVNINWKVL